MSRNKSRPLVLIFAVRYLARFKTPILIQRGSESPPPKSPQEYVKLSLHLPLFIVERIDVSTHGSGREEELSSLPIHAIVSLTILYNATGGSELGLHYFLGNGVSSE